MTTALFILGGSTMIFGAGTSVIAYDRRERRLGTVLFIAGMITAMLGSFRLFLSM